MSGPLHGWARITVEHACKVFFGCLITILIIAATGGTLLAVGGTSIDGGTSEFVVQHSDVARRQQATDGRYNGEWYRQLEEKEAPQLDGRRRAAFLTTTNGLSLTLLYESKDGADLLTAPRLQEIVAAEKILLADFATKLRL